MKKSGKTALIVIICLLIAGAVGAYCVNKFVIAPKNNYLDAVALYESGEYEQALREFKQLGDYKDSAEYIQKCETNMDTDEKLEKQYEYALKLMSEKKYSEAISALIGMDDYKDSAEIISKCKKAKAAAENEEKYKQAQALLKKAEFDAAKTLFDKLGDYKDAKKKCSECDTLKAKWGKVKYSGAKIYFAKPSDSASTRYNEMWNIALSDVKSATGYEVQLVNDAGKKSTPKLFKGATNSYYFYSLGDSFPKSIVVRAYKESSEGSQTLYGKWQSFDIDYENVSEPTLISAQEESALKAQGNDISGLYNALFNVTG